MVASNTAGTVKTAGLPNITGSVDRALFTNATNASGAINISLSAESYGGGTSAGNKYKLNFNAANSNSIYGASNTVQPPSVTVRFIIKY